jgi:predicted amidophosphoribosyltransferase
MTLRWTRIDESMREQYYFLRPEDECLFLKEYQAGAGYAGETNSLISNIKKKPTAPSGQLYWKERDIAKCAGYFRDLIPENFHENTVFVPIPPSKAKDHPEYDDRLVRILQPSLGKGMDLRELVTQKQSMDASHKSGGKRATIEELIANYEIDESISEPQPARIVIVDDVITTGRHFRAMKAVLQERYPAAHIMGLFIARTIHDEDWDI